MSMCQPSPRGSATIHGSRHASSRQVPSASVSYQGPVAESAVAGAFVQVCRSTDVAISTVSTLAPDSGVRKREPV
jgi:D-tyrosyl-tRNA(Tyr) deacylase